MSEDGLNEIIEGYRNALRSYVTGDPEPVLSFFSHEDGVTLANPTGVPPQQGFDEVAAAARGGATTFREGGSLNFTEVDVHFDEVSRFGTSDLGYVLQLETYQGPVADSEQPGRMALRVTMIFRREGDAWKVIHRHADPVKS